MNAIIPFFRGRERGTRRSGLRAANRRRRIMLIEPLEGRQLLSLNPLTVESTADSGPNTLRAAITYSNANPSTTSTPNTITFAIPESDYTDQDNDSGLFYFEIDPVTPLPAITAPLIINGGSEESSELDPENNRIPLEGTPVIEISGSSMSSSVSSSASIGLTINASNVTIEQLSIYHFAGGGVDVSGSSSTSDTVQGNWIGIQSFGGNSQGNGTFGVLLVDGSSGATIGGTTTADLNVISGTTGPGIVLDAASGNWIDGNDIGTGTDGVSAAGNTGDGVVLEGGSSQNTVGGTSVGNLISFSGQSGVELSGSGDNLIEGNSIDTNGNKVSETGDGILFDSGASGNTVGGTTAGATNYITSNGFNGIEVSDSSGNLVEGNAIGDESGVGTTGGEDTLGNANDGVLFDDGATGNTLGGTLSGTIGGATPFSMNVISGNDANGVELKSSSVNGVTYTTSTNVIEGNYIGVASDGHSPVANTLAGVFVHGGATSSTIGGSAMGAGNVITGNNGAGVDISGAGTTGNVVSGNQIGTSSTGANDLGNGNGLDGVVIQSGATSNTVGGTTLYASNTISGNGIRSGDNDVDINDASSNRVEGNYIGAVPAGSVSTITVGDGVIVQNGATANTIGGSLSGLIGGTAAFSMNVISGNGANGVQITGTGTESNVVEGNDLGTDHSGLVALANAGDGVVIDTGATLNTVGGLTSGAQRHLRKPGQRGGPRLTE